MNIRDLRYLKALAQESHFGRAADICNVSQPTLSVQIKKMEESLGVELIERSGRTVILTDVGRNVLALANDALSSIDNIFSTAETARDPYSGQLQLGSIPTISPYLIPQSIRLAKEEFPRLKLGFLEDITERLNAGLLQGSLDAAILATDPEDPRLEAIKLYKEPFSVILPSNHPLSRIADIDIDDLVLNELILLPEGHCFRDQAVDLCERAQPSALHDVNVSSMETIISLVAAGQGISLIPSMALGGRWNAGDDICVRTLDHPNAYRQVNLTFRKSTPKRKLMESLADVILQSLPETMQP